MVYVVKRGDTLRKIADAHNSSVAEFLSANPNVVDADRISPGQELALPGAKPAAKQPAAKKPAAKKPAARKPAAKKPAAKKPVTYEVQSGDSMKGIAARFGVTLTELIAANPDVSNPDVIRKGQGLVIPSSAATPAAKKPAAKKPAAKKPAAKKPAAKKPAAKKPAAKKPAAKKPVTYEVQSGDSMKGIATRFGVTLTELIAANPDVPNPDVIRRGQTLLVPSPGAGKPASGTSKETGRKQSSIQRPRPTRKRNWTKEPVETRVLHVMERLVAYGYPVNGAAGILGNLFVESGVLPSRIQGSKPDTPMRSLDFDRVLTDFTPDDVMHRDAGRRRGPLLAGIGLAQWTSKGRRARLFTHKYRGKVLQGDILFDLDAQVDYLVTELLGTYVRVNRVVNDDGVTVDAAADEVLYEFEVPASVIGTGGKLPRTDSAVKKVFGIRRAEAHRARELYRSAHGV